MLEQTLKAFLRLTEERLSISLSKDVVRVGLKLTFCCSLKLVLDELCIPPPLFVELSSRFPVEDMCCLCCEEFTLDDDDADEEEEDDDKMEEEVFGN